MTKISFDSIKFTQKEDFIRAHFHKIFYFDIPIHEIGKIGEFIVENGSLIFDTEDDRRVSRRFQRILDRFFPFLSNSITNKPTIYVHQNSNIPLIGTNYFGLVDRGTNIIEVKPMNGCNLDCIYCSVDENKRTKDFIVEEEYLSQEFHKLADFKAKPGLEAHIAGQCEPTLYAPLTNLIKNIAKNKFVETISIDTNGMLLSEEFIEQLKKSGLTRINLSVNSLDEKNSKKIANGSYDIKKIRKLIPYIADRMDLIIAPVLMKDINEKDVEDIIKFVKDLKTKHKVQLGIQNFLRYKYGKKPGKEIEMNVFFKLLKEWEKKYDIDLTKLDIKFFQTKELEKPFKRDQIVPARIICDGRFAFEKIAYADNRAIVIPECKRTGMINTKITRDKDNIFYGDC